MKLEEIEKIAGALADSNRLKILQEIGKRGSMTCTEAQEMTPLAQPTVSHHIKTLIECGLVKADKEGRCIRISLNKDRADELRSFLATLS